jgi:hypothetical protein
VLAGERIFATGLVWSCSSHRGAGAWEEPGSYLGFSDLQPWLPLSPRMAQVNRTAVMVARGSGETRCAVDHRIWGSEFHQTRQNGFQRWVPRASRHLHRPGHRMCPTPGWRKWPGSAVSQLLGGFVRVLVFTARALASRQSLLSWDRVWPSGSALRVLGCCGGVLGGRPCLSRWCCVPRQDRAGEHPGSPSSGSLAL